MPELREVETIARGLAKRIIGDRINSVWLGEKPEPLKSPALEMAATLEHSRIAAVRRMGKHIVFDLERNGAGRTLLSDKSEQSPRKRRGQKGQPVPPSAKAQWIVHLGMTGSLQVCDAQTETARHTHAILKLESGKELRFVDPRR